MDTATIKKAREWARTEYSKRREYSHVHPSHDVADILQEAETRFGLDTFGVEGWCDDVGNKGVSYLNTGDLYDVTIVVVTDRSSARFIVGCLAAQQQHWDVLRRRASRSRHR